MQNGPPASLPEARTVCRKSRLRPAFSRFNSKSIGLSEAVLNYQSFALYTTRPAADGGMVCFIVAVK